MGERSADFGDWQWTLQHARFWRPYRIFGRLQSWQHAMRACRKVRNASLHRPAWMRRETVLGALPVADIAASLRSNGYCVGLCLPSQLVDVGSGPQLGHGLPPIRDPHPFEKTGLAGGAGLPR